MRLRGVSRTRVIGLCALGPLAALAACASDFNTTRTVPTRRSVGTELFGFVCDRVGANSLHEDLTGASYKAVCHADSSGVFASKVDQTVLPPLQDGAVNAAGQPVPLAQQQADRAAAIARIEALAADRDTLPNAASPGVPYRPGLIDALDSALPDVQMAIKDIYNSDSTQSCNAPASGGQAGLHHELQDLLRRMTSLYNDGTVPQSTESLSRQMDAFKASIDAQTSLAHFNAREGYRPVDIALGVARPLIAYPGLRDLANSAFALISADSDPYSLDSSNQHQAVAGGARPQFDKMLEVAHAELSNATADPPAATLSVGSDPTTGVSVLSRPRTDLEVLQGLMFAEDPAFGGGTPRYISRRDPRGVVQVAMTDAGLPAPFVGDDAGLPQIDPATGNFITNGATPPTPFFTVGEPASVTRDTFGRALTAPAGSLMYGYLNTSESFTASVLRNALPLVNPDPAAKHETMMDALAGVNVLMGTRDVAGSPTTKTYADGSSVQYSAFHPEASPILDLLYAGGQVLGDKTSIDTLSFAKKLLQSNTADLARVGGDALYAKTQIADLHPEAKLPATSTFWDEVLDLTIAIEQEPGLLEDVLGAMSNKDTAQIGWVFSQYMQFGDHISYDHQNLNGPVKNYTTNTLDEPLTKVDRTKPATGANRSDFQKFVQVIHDTNNVTVCNKAGAVVHAKGVPLLSIAGVNLVSTDIDIPTGANASAGAIVGGIISLAYGGKKSFAECEVFKIDNVAAFYLDSMIGKANLYFRDNVIRNGLIAGIGKSTVGVIEQSSNIGWNANGFDGFWDDPTSATFRPRPEWLDRLVNFDIAKDSPNSGDVNYTTNHFLADLNGPHIGTQVCKERIIPDPCVSSSTCNGVTDIGADKMIHGLRDCNDGDWLIQRDQDATMVWEDFGFFKAVSPLVTAFANHKREDLFLQLMEIVHKHWQDAAAANATPDECLLGYTAAGTAINCTKDGAVTYEPLLAELFSADFWQGLTNLMTVAQGVTVNHCTAYDTKSGTCKTSAPINGVTVLANATRALVDPALSKGVALTDRHGSVTSKRNDGTTNPQVTPVYLLLQALDSMDSQFTAYAAAHPSDAQRQGQWKSARSQLVDQFLSFTGQNTANAAFANPAVPKIAPVLLDVLMSQLLAQCPATFQDTSSTCAWARQTLTKNAATTVGGPLFASSVDLLDQMRQDTTTRIETEKLIAYLVDAASSNDALVELLASANDVLQVMRDDTNIVPLLKVLATSTLPTTKDASGNTVKGVVDANLALLQKLSGRAMNTSVKTNTAYEDCAREVDPNQVLTTALGYLVTPMKDPSGKPIETPLEVVMSAIADVNRAKPDSTASLVAADYGNIADQVSQMLISPESGLEQFYAIVRDGTGH